MGKIIRRSLNNEVIVNHVGLLECQSEGFYKSIPLHKSNKNTGKIINNFFRNLKIPKGLKQSERHLIKEKGSTPIKNTLKPMYFLSLFILIGG